MVTLSPPKAMQTQLIEAFLFEPVCVGKKFRQIVRHMYKPAR